jgi:hypothetical protein
MLQNFLHYLSQNNQPLYERLSHLLLMTETGHELLLRIQAGGQEFDFIMLDNLNFILQAFPVSNPATIKRLIIDGTMRAQGGQISGFFQHGGN